MKNVSETTMPDGSRLWDDGFGELFSSHSAALTSHRRKADIVRRKVEAMTFSEAVDAAREAERELAPGLEDVKEMLKGVNEELADFGIQPIHVMQAPGRITFLPPSEARTPTLKDGRECLIWLHAFSYALDLVADKCGIAPKQGEQNEQENKTNLEAHL